MLLANLYEELGTKGATALLGVLIGGIIAWLIGSWRRRRERRRIFEGDARETVIVAQHLVETVASPNGGKRPTTLRVRTVGQAELRHVVPNGHLASVLLHRARRVTTRDTLISMDGAEGSFLLETLTGFVCDRAAHAPFEHDLYVMAPCCEPQELAQFQPITIILIAASDLLLFDSWPHCRDMQVEHGSDGARILTLIAMARRFREEQGRLEQLRKAGKRTTYVETMYILDLPLDKRSAPIPTKEVPWGRYEAVLKQMNLE
jgi:hypothetical protein